MKISSVSKLSFLILLTSLFFPWTTTAVNSTLNFRSDTSNFSEAANVSRPGCPTKCGNLTVPFPFGIGINSGCSINPFFDIHCNTSFDPPKPFLLSASHDLEVIGITETKIRMKNGLAGRCYDQNGTITQNEIFTMDLSGTPFSFSNENKLTVVGCDDISLMRRGLDTFSSYASSCVAMCSKTQDLSDGFCSGIGCCQASIPKGLQSIYISLMSLTGHTDIHSFNPCAYSFLAEQSSYKFNISDVSDPSFPYRTLENVPLLIDWAIGNKTCDQMRNLSGVICEGDSVCADSGTTLGGYRCNCSKGYHGNPYLSPGCRG